MSITMIGCVLFVLVLVTPEICEANPDLLRNFSFTLFGLHNDANSSEALSMSFDRWIQRSTSHPWHPQTIVTLQAVDVFVLCSREETAIGSSCPFYSELLKQLERFWNAGSIPLMQLFPAFDPSADSESFANMMKYVDDAYGGRYNDALLSHDGEHTAAAYFNVRQDMFGLLMHVLLPFLFPTVNFTVVTSSATGSGNSNVQITSTVPLTNNDLASARRLYLHFAPAYNSYRFPWCVANIHNGSAFENNASSYRTLWEEVVIRFLHEPLAKWLRLNDGRVSKDVGNYVQLMWSMTVTQRSDDDDGAPFNTSKVVSWIPQWNCSWYSAASTTTTPSASLSLCGPDWLATTGLNMNVSALRYVDDVYTVFDPANDVLTILSQQFSRLWNRSPNLDNISVPIAFVDIGTTVDPDDPGNRQQKDEWMYRLLLDAFLNANVRMAVPLNTQFVYTTFGSHPTQPNAEVYAYNNSNCCDGVDALNGADVLTKVSAAVIVATNLDLIPLADIQSLGTCSSCRLIDDLTFMGASYGGVACTCSNTTTPAPTTDNTSSWVTRFISDPLVIVCIIVVVLVAVVLLLWRRRSQHTAVTQRRMILGRYVVRRILQHCRHFSSVLIAYDTMQDIDVIVKQYVLASDSAIALANNEIEKYRACTGYPNLVQLVQSTFAWKQATRRGGRALRNMQQPTVGDANDDTRSVQHSQNFRETLPGHGLPAASPTSVGRFVLNEDNAAAVPFAIVVMRKYASGDLRAHVEQRKSEASDTVVDPHTGISYIECVSLLTQLCLALHTLHKVVRPGDPMLHRDVKPENIFLERRPLKAKQDSFVYLAFLGDFGCCVYASQLKAQQNGQTSFTPSSPSSSFSPTRQGILTSGSSQATDISRTFLATKAVGTSKYMSPEARLGEYSTAGDIWSAACVVLFMALRFVPADYSNALREGEDFEHSARETLSGHALFPNWLTDMLLRRMLHFDPTRRPSAEEVLSAIRSGVTGAPTIDLVLHKRNVEDELGNPAPTEAEKNQFETGVSLECAPEDVRQGAAEQSLNAANGDDQHQLLLLARGEEEMAAEDAMNQEALLVLDDSDIIRTADESSQLIQSVA